MNSFTNKKALEVNNLSIKYPSRENYSIKDVSFKINAGDFVWISGNSAAGKSTLLKSISGFIPRIIPAELNGSILFKEQDVLEKNEPIREICMVHQDPESQFCTENVEDEIAFGLENFKIPKEEIEKRIENTLKKLNCKNLKHRKLRTLSGGEKQKVAIASMLVLNPDLLILDEPTANLDPVSMKEVLETIKKIKETNKDLIILIAEHRIKRLKDEIDAVIKFKKGKISKKINNFQEMREELKEKLINYPYPSFERSNCQQNQVILDIDGLEYEVEGKKILKNINLQIKEGEIIALDNKNTIKNRSLPWEIGKKTGFVFQNPNHQIFENSIESEMFFAPKNYEKGKENAKNNLKRIIKEENIEESTHPFTLSFGQKRRLNIYSSSSHKPDLFIIDEPFSGQDHKNVIKITKLLNDLWKKGKTLILVIHNLEFAKKFCTRAIVLKNGKVQFNGEPNKLKNIEGKTENEK